MEFVTLYRPHRVNDRLPDEASLEQIEGGYLLTAKLSDGRFTALLPLSDDVTLRADSMTTKGAIKLKLECSDAQPPQILEVREGDLH
jgi:hypothetical protein